MINVKGNNFNFGLTIYLKSQADRQAAKRYQQAYEDRQELKQTTKITN